MKFQGDRNPNAKKTDDYTADDVPAEEEARPKSKLDLNEPEIAQEEDEDEVEETEEQVLPGAQPEVEVKPSEPASRKRKPRKE